MCLGKSENVSRNENDLRLGLDFGRSLSKIRASLSLVSPDITES